jgi:hypothetical protein
MTRVVYLAVLVVAGAGAKADPGVGFADGAPVRNDQVDKFRQIQVGDAEGVIVTANRSDRTAWTPDEKSIHSFERGLSSFLKIARPPEDPDLYRKISQYKRQYIGKLRRRKRALFVVFACQTPPDWQNTVRIRKDGGSCFFEVEYDLPSGSYQNLHVHHPS